MKSGNPFKYGSVVGKETFCNRKEEMKQLTAYMENSQSVWLYSPRRYGKTSLIQRVFSETITVKTIYIDLYNVKSTDDFCKRYARLISNELFNWQDNIKSLSEKLIQSFKGLKPSISFDESGNPSFSLQAESIKTQSDVETILEVPNEISKKTGKKICITFDECQEIKRIDPFLINWMRSAFQFHENISYIFMGSQQSLMESIFTDAHSPFYEFGVKMHLQPITNNELAGYIRKRFKSREISIENHVVDKILEISEGHPHYTQFFASEVFFLIKTGADQNSPEFNRQWLNKIINGQSHIFQNIYDQLTNIQRTVLQTIALAPANEELFSSKAREKYGLPASSSLNSSLTSLINKAIISKNGTSYKLVNPIFKAWLKDLN